MNLNESRKTGWLAGVIEQILTSLARLPQWIVPSVLGAALLFIITAMRGVVLLITVPPSPQGAFAFLVALVVATSAGAVAGVIYAASRSVLRPLGPVGDALTGALAGCAYVLAILVPAKFLLGDDTLDTSESWIIACGFGAGFGVACTILYWYYRRRTS